jgi:hypothetical protein
VVECGGLENRFPPIGGTGVRIPLSPQRQINPVRQPADGIFVFQVSEPSLLERREMKNKKTSRMK